MNNTKSQTLRRADSSRGESSTPTSPSWITERDALRLFGDRTSRAVIAIFLARRSARNPVFFVPPHLAGLHGLRPADLYWAYNRLEGQLIQTVTAERGRFRRIRLLPEWESRESKKRSSTGHQKHCPPVEQPRDGERVIIDSKEIRNRIPGLERDTTPEVIETLQELAVAHARRGSDRNTTG